MYFSMLKKLIICSLASVILVWAISTIGDFLVSSKTIKNKVSPSIKKVLGDSIYSDPAAKSTISVVNVALTMLANADTNAGQIVFKKCKACHSTAKGGRNKIGPNLWDIVGRSKASTANYRFSKALKNHGGSWSYQDLDKFLNNPKTYVNGTKMSFAGIKNAKDRANLIIYLRSLSNQPKSLP